MANRWSVASGLASALATWDGGVSVPVSGDRVLISRLGTAAGYLTNAAGYAIGATAITVITGTGTMPVGESVQFAGDPNYYTVATALTAGVVTLAAPGLLQAIPAVATVVRQTGHVVTVDGTYEWGDDSTATITINTISTTASIWVAGTLRASRVANSYLTCNGTIRTATTVGAGIDYGRTLIGTGVQDPIPWGVSARMSLNKSAALAVVKYGLYVDNAAAFFCAGDEKNPNATLLADAAAGQATITVDNVTGWRAGDSVAISSTTASSHSTQNEARTILSINTSGANPVVTMTANLPTRI